MVPNPVGVPSSLAWRPLHTKWVCNTQRGLQLSAPPAECCLRKVGLARNHLPDGSHPKKVLTRKWFPAAVPRVRFVIASTTFLGYPRAKFQL